MNEWKLTASETERCISKHEIAELAQQKLVGNLEQYWFIDGEPCEQCDSVLSVSKEDWQELRKGVGLE